jgi:cysteinyl-tRNA synthetase
MLKDEEVITKPMVRYGYNEWAQRKNVLFTFRADDLIFYGISQCKLRTDKFDKELGRHIAKERAKKAYQDFINWKSESVTPYSNYGHIEQADIKKLLNYFDNVAPEDFPRKK